MNESTSQCCERWARLGDRGVGRKHSSGGCQPLPLYPFPTRLAAITYAAMRHAASLQRARHICLPRREKISQPSSQQWTALRTQRGGEHASPPHTPTLNPSGTLLLAMRITRIRTRHDSHFFEGRGREDRGGRIGKGWGSAVHFRLLPLASHLRH